MTDHDDSAAEFYRKESEQLAAALDWIVQYIDSGGKDLIVIWECAELALSDAAENRGG